VPELAGDVKHVGYSKKAVSHALCVEVPPGCTYSEDKTREWVRNSPVPMAAVVPGLIKFLTLACSHFTQVMRCIEAKVKSENKKLGDGTHYDVEVIRETDALMAAAVDTGIEW
jgi:hypothetical protein